MPKPTSVSPPFYTGNESTASHGDRQDALGGIQLSKTAERFLQDVYFTCMFNSTLVFHRPSFSRAWEEGRLPMHVLLAVYATATM